MIQSIFKKFKATPSGALLALAAAAALTGLCIIWAPPSSPFQPSRGSLRGSMQTESGSKIFPSIAITSMGLSNDARSVVTVTTDVISAQIDTLGGQITSAELLRYNEATSTDGHTELLTTRGGRYFVAQSGLVAAGTSLPDHNTVYQLDADRTVVSAGSVSVVMTAVKNGIRLTKTFRFEPGSYLVTLTHDVLNAGGSIVAPIAYIQLRHDGLKPSGAGLVSSGFSGPVVYTPEQGYQKMSFKSVERGTSVHAAVSRHGWLAIPQRFFATAIIPQDGQLREIYTQFVDNRWISLGAKFPLPPVAAGEERSVKVSLYFGPQDADKLAAAAPSFDLVQDYGWLAPIAHPMFWMLRQIQGELGNWGWAIVAFTLMLRLLCLPMSASSHRRMAKINQLAPKLKQLRDKLGGDAVKFHQATMALYKSEEINVAGGCLPILMQLPFFVAIYWVLQSSIELRGAPWVGWVHDLSRPDPFFVLPVLYTITVIASMKFNPKPVDPDHAYAAWAVPIGLSILFVFMPAGLVLYWVISNLASVAQQYYFSRVHPVTPPMEGAGADVDRR